MDNFGLSKSIHSLAGVSEAAIAEKTREAMQRVYLWMTMGMMITAIVAWLTVSTPLAFTVITNPFLFFGAIIVELGLVFYLSARIQKLNPTTALMLFFLYAALNGLTLSVVLLSYTATTVVVAFAATACLFAAMSIIGYTTSIDLTRFGGILFIALIGFLIGTVINIFWASSALYWFLTYFGILLFLGLTVYDTQRVKAWTAQSMVSGGGELTLQRIGVLGALALYLDFINLFLLILRLFSRD